MHTRTRSRSSSVSGSPSKPHHGAGSSLRSPTTGVGSSSVSTSQQHSYRIPIIGHSNSHIASPVINGPGASGSNSHSNAHGSGNGNNINASRSPSLTPRLSIRTPSMMLHSHPTSFDRYFRSPFSSFVAKRARSSRRTLLYLLLLLTSWFLLSRPSTTNELVKLKALETACRIFPWKSDCLGVHSPFDYLHFERELGYLMYPAHEARKSTEGTLDDSGSGTEARYLGSRKKFTGNGAENVAAPSQPHPIHLLMDSAKRMWTRKVERQSKTLREAVEAIQKTDETLTTWQEYERRYNRRPPKGFADWWWYAKGHNFLLVDEFDSLDEKILPLLAIPSSVMRKRAETIQHDANFWIQDKTFTLQLSGGGKGVDASGPMSIHVDRPNQMKQLIQPIAKYLPDMNLTFTGHDIPWIVMSGEAREQHIRSAKAGQYVPEKFLTDPIDDWKYDGWAQSCPPNSPMRKAARFSDRLKDQAKVAPPAQKSLIHDHVQAMDVCSHPERQTLHGFTLWDGPRCGLVYPLFAMTSTSMHSDLLVPPIDQYDRPVGNDPRWEEKKRDKIVWRGSTTGADLNLAWMRIYSQRPRLCRLPAQTGPITLTYAPNDKFGQLGPTQEFTADKRTLAKEWFDFQFLGKPEQCGDSVACAEFAKEFTWSEYMGQDEQNEYKYVMDVDGNGWSGRFHRLLSTNSLVFKSTIFPEWYRDHIQPWLHYVPISPDYNDLWEVMAFFKGDENGRGEHDALAKEIAMAGKEFAKTCWRMEDMRIYTYRLLLEYARVLYRDDDNPTSMDM
ncbi:BZ3500_MvSof-1268-A1-R1_Chr2-1g04314 [Microbotryum saponariae]|uniref:BZ3500_MvSof-1268-A1-R1_Chr2-1g04314 protein n=1 Tax=Microbotryum saponariae TaxID=289078 RepID=A0A2X0KK50_9BASI|nr:BZ3500_MvSof-1268-A1-R1_Chr2-1g04314 [Microbotryum saponariae]SCZ91406.1 BZ3501_MvSof-1269-A2-R1_Chr2-1g03970 [Microbotryum saponariae]